MPLVGSRHTSVQASVPGRSRGQARTTDDERINHPTRVLSLVAPAPGRATGKWCIRATREGPRMRSPAMQQARPRVGVGKTHSASDPARWRTGPDADVPWVSVLPADQ